MKIGDVQLDQVAWVYIRTPAEAGTFGGTYGRVLPLDSPIVQARPDEFAPVYAIAAQPPSNDGVLPPFPTLDNIEWADAELVEIGRRVVEYAKAHPELAV